MDIKYTRRIHSNLRLLSFHYGFPFSLGDPNVRQIEVTNACNYRCPMCPHTGAMTRRVEYMGFSLYKRIIDKLLPSNDEVYLHFLGEPLMHPFLDKMIRYGKSRGLGIGFFTNGSLLTEENSRKIIDVGLDDLVISFEVIEETFEDLRDGGDFQQVRQNIMRFLRLRGLKTKPRVTISSITWPKDKKRLENRFWRGKVDRFVMKEIHDWSGDVLEITQIAGRKSDTNKVCLFPWSRMSVLVDGRVVPCCVDYDGKCVLGDLKKDSLQSIWNGEKMISLRKALLEGRKDDIKLCNKCTLGAEAKGILRDRLHVLHRIKSRVLLPRH